MKNSALHSSAEKAITSYLSECISKPKDDKTWLQAVLNVLSAVMHAAVMSALDHHAHNCLFFV